ncbi:MAG: ATP-binding cassette domain-containing protein [Gammaproteobacteria bacterium]|nr:MAG: ATP-binding cassette domain-containing protein [Gammaproteobacteria bacterium]
MLSFSGLALRRSTTLLFENASFRVYSGQKLGITGANGCGKSSLFALIRGELSPDEGNFSLPSDWAVASVEQETRLSEQLALEYVIDGDTELRQTQARLLQAEREQNSMQIAACHERLQEIDGYQAESRAARLLAGLGFADAEMSEPLARFSGGWIMRLNLARALMCRSDLLLLDEPTNHLDLDAVIWLEQWLQRYRGSLLLVSHDRDFLDAVVDSIAHIEDQRITLYRGNYSAFEQQRAERLAQQQAAYHKQQQSIAHMQRYIERFRAKATKAKQAQSRIKALERMQLIAPAHVDSPFEFEFRAPHSLPSSLVRLDRVATGYGDNRVLEGIDFSLIPGERIGLLGLNGAGKSTFIKLLAGELPAFDGEVTRAKELRIGYFAQHQVEQLDLEASALLAMQRLDPDLSERDIRGYLGGFNFRGDKVLQAVKTYSGGQKARLVLALLIWQRPNLLLLDEPTNHLDLEMRLALNQALQGFDGSVILVSHDRHLLRSVCDDLWLVDRGALQRFEQDLDAYPAWLAQRKAGGQVQSEARGRQDQQQRRELKSHAARLNRIEREIARLSETQAKLERQLSDHSIYDESNREILNATLAQQAENRKRLSLAEEDWLQLSETIESLQQPG